MKGLRVYMMIEGYFGGAGQSICTKTPSCCFSHFALFLHSPLCQPATQSTSTLRIEDLRRSWCPGDGCLLPAHGFGSTGESPVVIWGPHEMPGWKSTSKWMSIYLNNILIHYHQHQQKAPSLSSIRQLTSRAGFHHLYCECYWSTSTRDRVVHTCRTAVLLL